jgi:uncharacterized protein (DUF2164 family)
MPIELTKQEIAEIVPSLKQYFREEFEEELSDMRARFLLEYFMSEIAPIAYNRGVKDAESFFRAHVEDLSGACYEAPMTWWLKKKR